MEAVRGLGSGARAGAALPLPRSSGAVLSRVPPACARMRAGVGRRLVASVGPPGEARTRVHERPSGGFLVASRELGDSEERPNPRAAPPRLVCVVNNPQFRQFVCRCQQSDGDSTPSRAAQDERETLGVKIALAALRFYKSYTVTSANVTSANDTLISRIVTPQPFKNGGLRGITYWATRLTDSWPGEISPMLPAGCRYVPTCSEYSMQSYRTYGVLKGTILTAWRLLRCNPFGGHGFDPPRWFGEEIPPKV